MRAHPPPPFARLGVSHVPQCFLVSVALFAAAFFTHIAAGALAVAVGILVVSGVTWLYMDYRKARDLPQSPRCFQISQVLLPAHTVAVHGLPRHVHVHNPAPPLLPSSPHFSWCHVSGVAQAGPAQGRRARCRVGCGGARAFLLIRTAPPWLLLPQERGWRRSVGRQGGA